MPFKKGKSGNPKGRPPVFPLPPIPLSNIDDKDLEPFRKTVGKPATHKELSKLRNILFKKALVNALELNNIHIVIMLLRLFPAEPMDEEEVRMRFKENRQKYLSVFKDILAEASGETLNGEKIKSMMSEARKRTQGK